MPSILEVKNYLSGSLKKTTDFPITVLLVDDQSIVAESIKKMLDGHLDIRFYYCSNPSQAIAMASKVSPTVILQDLVMPDIDGLLLVRYFRANPKTRDIPLIVLSNKEDPDTKAEAFSLGANDYIVKLPDKLELIARIRYHSNAYIRLLERNEAYKRIEESQRILNRELADAAQYVTSLLPEPLEGVIQTSWRFIPSTQLGGDAFGYHWLDEDHFGIYLLDVCGHGVGAALLSITVINVLRTQSLKNTDFFDPSSVLKGLNETFQMERHNFMFFTIWYGIYNKKTRKMTYSSGGHPPAILISGDTGEMKKLKTEGLVIGGVLDTQFVKDEISIELPSTLYVFSDGIYEIEKEDGAVMQFDEFIDTVNLKGDASHKSVEDVVNFGKELTHHRPFPDDFSILRIDFS